MLIWHRRARKTTTALYEIIKQAFLRVGVYWHIFPTYGEAKDAVWRDPHMLFSIIPSYLIHKRNEAELVLYLINGSIIQLKGADNPQALRGAGPVGVVLDEFSVMKEETWSQIVEPIISVNGGWCWFIGTPRGKNHLFTVYIKGQKGISNWKSWHLPITKSHILSPADIETIRESMTEKDFGQEFMCDFLESEGVVFRNVRAACTSKPKQPVKDHIYVMGLDLAKVTDFTVITVYDRMTNEQVYQDRFQTIEWPFQKKRIAEISQYYNNALVILDATGVGDPIADDLIRFGIPVQPVKITEQIKKELIEKLSIWIEQRKCTMIPLAETIFEFENFSYEIGPSRRIRYGARQGFHDDIVIAHSLAVSGLQPIIREYPTADKTALQQYYLNLKQSHVVSGQTEW